MSFLLPFWITSSNFYFPFRILFYRIKFCCVRTNFCLPSQILMFRFTRNSVLSWGTSTTTCNFFRIHINFYDQIICFQFMAHRVPNRFWLQSSSPSSTFHVEVFFHDYLSRRTHAYLPLTFAISDCFGVECERNLRTTKQIFLFPRRAWKTTFNASTWSNPMLSRLFSSFRVKSKCVISFPLHPSWIQPPWSRLSPSHVETLARHALFHSFQLLLVDCHYKRNILFSFPLFWSGVVAFLGIHGNLANTTLVLNDPLLVVGSNRMHHNNGSRSWSFILECPTNWRISILRHRLAAWSNELSSDVFPIGSPNRELDYWMMVLGTFNAEEQYASLNSFLIPDNGNNLLNFNNDFTANPEMHQYHSIHMGSVLLLHMCLKFVW